MKRLDWSALDDAGRAAALARAPLSRSPGLRERVARILGQVRARGDEALRELTARFDRCELDALEVAPGEFAQAEAHLDPALKRALDEAAARIELFHRACAPPSVVSVETAPGVRVERILRAIARVGLYVPAGEAPLPSTALMLGIPARIAGCREAILCTPPRAGGSCDPAVLYAARRCGVKRVFKLGGAQAIAAMAFGSGSVPKCDKLFGPGNAWVTEAKLQVSVDPEGAAMDMPAGPSEVLVIADEGADASFVAADLLAQAEHGPDSQVILLSPSPELLDSVAEEMAAQCEGLPRAHIVQRSLANGCAILVGSLQEAVAISNRYAPEHLILQVAQPRALLEAVESAGSVFVGAWTPETLGDYCSGSNHVLPTHGHARSYSGLSVASFLKAITVQEASESGLRAIGSCAAVMAEAEKLEAHRNAVALRLSAAAGLGLVAVEGPP